jgi:hypothetical protein
MCYIITYLHYYLPGSQRLWDGEWDEEWERASVTDISRIINRTETPDNPDGPSGGFCCLQRLSTSEVSSVYTRIGWLSIVLQAIFPQNL